MLHGWGPSLDGGWADRVQIYDLAIGAAGRTTTAHGIKAFIRFHLENVYVRGFSGNGIAIYVSMGAGSNANNWYISNCRVDTCGGHWLYLHGPDANTGVAILLSSNWIFAHGHMPSSVWRRPGGATFLGIYESRLKNRIHNVLPGLNTTHI